MDQSTWVVVLSQVNFPTMVFGTFSTPNAAQRFADGSARVEIEVRECGYKVEVVEMTEQY